MVLNNPGNADISFALDTYHGMVLPDQMVDLFFVFKVLHNFKYSLYQFTFTPIPPIPILVILDFFYYSHSN